MIRENYLKLREHKIFLANLEEVITAVFFKNKGNILSRSEPPLISEDLKVKQVTLGL